MASLRHHVFVHLFAYLFPYVFMAVALTSAGCFDVSSGATAPILIDDFDRDDRLPADPHFDQWRCGRFRPGTAQNCDCRYDDGIYHSYPRSMYLEAELQDIPDAQQDFGGAQLYTQANVPEDLSRMRRIGFSVMLDPTTTVRGATLYVELHCSLAQPEGNTAPSQRFAQHGVTYTNTEAWQSFAIDLTPVNFPPPTNYVGAGVVGGLPACLALIDGIHFSVNAQLPDGQSGAVTFHLDDVYFE